MERLALNGLNWEAFFFRIIVVLKKIGLEFFAALQSEDIRVEVL